MTTDKKLDLASIANALSNHRIERLNPSNRGHAAVAMLLKESSPSPEVLFIIRAEHDRDPWSGNIAFPGGRLNREDRSPRQAAERETHEELALDLARAKYLGRLSDLYGATMPVLVSCFVYQLLEPARLQPNHEVASTFWVPLAKLLEPGRQQHRTFFYRGEERTHPVVDLLAPQQPLLWGITYRLMRNFFALCGLDFGSPEPPESRLS
ncbi:MAG: CoA pyrophosphatase [Desulfuromonadales bacterium]|nr:CoA pyrophosphatase [Desulfuromonadales bacterium]